MTDMELNTDADLPSEVPATERAQEAATAEQLHHVSPAEAFSIALKHWEEGRPRKAETVCRKLLAVIPAHARALHLLGLLVYTKGENELAVELIRKAIKIRPDLREFYNSMGMVLMVLGKYQQALASYQQVLAMMPADERKDTPKLFSNIANAYQLLGNFDEAIKYHDHALNLNPGDVIATWNRSHIFMAQGDFAAGWAGYERRFELGKAREKFYPHQFDVPKWDGTEFKGKRLFIHDEQGLGDIVQFARYLPLAKARGGHVIFEVRGALLELFRSLDGVDELVERMPNTRTSLSFDYYCPIMSLGAVLGTTVDNVPNKTPYLHADPARVKDWETRFGGPGLKVGLVWAGNLNNIPLRHRTAELNHFLPILKVPGVSFFGLQKGDTSGAVDELPEALRFPNYGDDFNDFADTAAAMANLDMVITVDTSVAHVAGALGIPTWVMLSYPPDWRWLLDREDSPWYPSMRLFRQRHPGDWEHIAQQAAYALSRQVNKKTAGNQSSRNQQKAGS